MEQSSSDEDLRSRFSTYVKYLSEKREQVEELSDTTDINSAILTVEVSCPPFLMGVGLQD